jgi:hypothetical protein
MWFARKPRAMRAKQTFFVIEGGRPRAFVREGQLFTRHHRVVKAYRRFFEREAGPSGDGEIGQP